MVCAGDARVDDLEQVPVLKRRSDALLVRELLVDGVLCYVCPRRDTNTDLGGVAYGILLIVSRKPPVAYSYLETRWK